MKRSEMLEEIRSLLSVCSGSQSTSKTAEQILERIENLGMLPPKAEIKIGQHSTADYFWEPETEIEQLEFDLDKEEVCCKRGCGECLPD